MLRRSFAALCAVALTATSASAQLFDFEGADSPDGTATPFSLTRGGLTLTFTGSPLPMSISGPSSGFSLLTGNILTDVDDIAGTLEIGFSAPRSTISLLFALNDRSNTTTLTMNLFSGGLIVGSVSSMGTIPPAFGFPEGTLSFAGASFDQAFLFTDGTPNFAIDDIRVGPQAVIPEPATVALLATGLLAVGGVATRRRRA